MKKFLKTLSVIAILIGSLLLVFLFFIFNSRNIKNYFSALKGYYPANNYQIGSVATSTDLLPGLSLWEMYSDTSNSKLTVSVWDELENESELNFKVNDEVAIHLYDDNEGRYTKVGKITGKIISVYEEYVTFTKLPAVKYEISLNPPSESLRAKHRSRGSMSKFSEEGQELSLDHHSIRNINRNKYICVVVDTIERQGLETSDNLIKFQLKKIETGQKVYSSTAGDSFSNEVIGVNEKEQILMSKKVEGKQVYDFDCGDIPK